MNRYTPAVCLILALVFCTTIRAQTTPIKINVILLGSFHYGATSDRNSTPFSDLFSNKRQKELDSIALAIHTFGVNTFFLETQFTEQKYQDSLYQLYTKGKLLDTNELKDERVQIAFRAAALSGAKLIAADYHQELPYDLMNEYETLHKNDTLASYPFFDGSYPFTLKQLKLSATPLPQYYIQLNNAYNRQRILFDYLHYALAYGIDTNFVGVQFAASWYDRNLKIFTNIVRKIDLKKDKTIVVLFGSSHTAILHQFFSNHPYFKIVELDTIFK